MGIYKYDSLVLGLFWPNDTKKWPKQYFGTIQIFHPYWLNIWLELYQNLVLVIFWYQWDTYSHPTYPKSCLVAFKTAYVLLDCPRIRLAYIYKVPILTFLIKLTSFIFGWVVLRWVASTIWSDLALQELQQNSRISEKNIPCLFWSTTLEI